MVQGAFPARLGLVLVLNPPSFFKMALKMASPLLASGSRLLERIVLLDSPKALQQYIHPEVKNKNVTGLV